MLQKTKTSDLAFEAILVVSCTAACFKCWLDAESKHKTVSTKSEGSLKFTRNAFTIKYSQHMIPATGGKATARTSRKLMNLFRMPRAPAALPMMPHAIVTRGRGMWQPHMSKKATMAKPEKYRLVQLITISPSHNDHHSSDAY